MNLKANFVAFSSTVCAISLFISVSTTYFSYETNTSVTRETGGDIEALSVCAQFKHKNFSYNRFLELTRNIKLVDIVEFDAIDVNKMRSLKYYITNRICFRLFANDIQQDTSSMQVNSSVQFSWTLRSSPSINVTILGSRATIIFHSPFEIPGTQRRAIYLSNKLLVDYTRVVQRNH